MIIAVAGPYSAETPEQRQMNLDKMNEAAAKLLLKGHIPIIGVNAALFVVDKAGLTGKVRSKAIMDISMAVIENCEAILMLAESPGANKERDRLIAKGCPVYGNIDDVPNL